MERRRQLMCLRLSKKDGYYLTFMYFSHILYFTPAYFRTYNAPTSVIFQDISSGLFGIQIPFSFIRSSLPSFVNRVSCSFIRFGSLGLTVTSLFTYFIRVFTDYITYITSFTSKLKRRTVSYLHRQIQVKKPVG